MATPKTVKMVIFGALLAGAGCFLGLVLRWAGDGHESLIPFLWDALYLMFWFLGAVVAVAVTGGLVAVLLRPFWVAAIAFAVSALAMFLTWEISAVSIILAVIYFGVGLLFTLGVRREIGDRIRFSVWHLVRSQIILFVVLIAIACTSLYFGYAAEVEREGFSIPDDAVDWVVEVMDEHILGTVVPEGILSPEQKQDILDEIREFLEGEAESEIEPYERYIPMGLAAIVFMILMPVTYIIFWIPILILWFLFFILTRSGVVKKVTETVEVTRPSI